MKSQELTAEKDDIRRSNVLHTGKSQGLAENGQREGRYLWLGKSEQGNGLEAQHQQQEKPF